MEYNGIELLTLQFWEANFLQSWYDQFLRWNSTVKRINEIVIHADKIWLPEIRMGNR